MWRPIESEVDLPAVTALETNVLDFKGAPTDDRIEMAKDVAAMANAQGGTLLIGAYGPTRLAVYKPLTADEAKRVAESFDQTVKERCAPAPLVSVELIPRDGGRVVAVNVQPFPGQLVGVRVTKEESRMLNTSGAAKTRGLDGLLFFPVRAGTHTKFVTPEQIPMFIDARIRRIAIALDGAVGQTVVLFDVSTDRKRMFSETATVEAVDILTNTITLLLADGAGISPCSLPLDFVETACRAGDFWHVYLRGTLEPVDWSAHISDELRAVKFVFMPSR